MFKKLEQQRFLRDRESSSWTLKAKTKTWSSQNKCLLPQPTWTVSSSEVTRRALRLRLRAVPVFVERAAGLRRIGRSLKCQMRFSMRFSSAGQSQAIFELSATTQNQQRTDGSEFDNLVKQAFRWLLRKVLLLWNSKLLFSIDLP